LPENSVLLLKTIQMYDYIIVGLGVAGFSFLQQLEENGKNFIVFDNHSQQTTRIAGGMFNPVILKRFTPAWQRQKCYLMHFRNLKKPKKNMTERTYII